MTEGATIGAATPVQMSPTGGEASPVEEKTVSYVRKEFRATAESRGRPLAIAEAMVDRDVEIPGLNPKGKLLTLTTNEALVRKVADRQANTLDSLLAGSDLGSAEIVRLAPNWGEGFVRLLTHPVVASLLLSIATLGIIIELRTPGFGVPGGLGILSLILVLAGHYTVELVGWEELILVGLGLTLITLEVFVIPGFGIAGIAGIISTLAGFSLSLIGHGSTLAAFFGAMGRVAPHLVVQDAVVPRTKLADLLEEIHAIGMRHDVRVCNVFHAGDGNLHPNIPYDADDPAESARVAAAMSEIMHRCIAVGGTITGEHGVGLDKLDYMPALFSGDTLDAMCTLRDVFDPERRANPGKVVPVRSCREWLAAPSARAH